LAGLNLRGGAKLRLEISPMVDGAFMLKAVAVVRIRGKMVQKTISEMPCKNEEELWISVIHFGNDRLCDASEGKI